MHGGAAHHLYALALAALMGDDTARAAVGFSGGQWRRIFARFTPDTDPLGTVAYQREASAASIVVVTVHASRPGGGSAIPIPGGGGAGWLVAHTFPDDPRLPGLPAVMAGPGYREVVRYRPGRRCTIRVEDADETWFVKVFARPGGAAMHRDAVALAQAAAAGRLGFAVAGPGRFDPDTSALWQRPVPGVALKPRLLGPEGLGTAEHAGRALASLHFSGIEPAGVAAPRAALGRARSAAADLTRRLPALGSAADAVLARIDAIERATPDRPLRPLHGAPHPGQWLADGDRLALVDFDRFGLGDPESDIAVFAAEIDYETLAPEGLNARFQAGYEASGAPLDLRLLHAYRAAGHIAAARRITRRLRPGAAERAAAAVASATAELDAADGVHGGP